MSDSKKEEDAPNTLSNRDTVDVSDDLSLSDSDPDESPELLSRKVEDSSSSSSEEEERIQPVLLGKPAFKLTGGSSKFSYRSRNIFDQLDSAAKLTSTQLAEDNVLDGTFARPAPPSPPHAYVKPGGASARTKKSPSAQVMPDYLSHPERWTRYNLDDVPETSDKKNSQVAHEFIQSLQNRRRSQEVTVDAFMPAFNQDRSSSEHKIIFTKPSQTSKDEGKTAIKEEQAKSKEVGLVHLGEDGQEEEEGGTTYSVYQSHTLQDEEKKRKRVPEKEDVTEEGKTVNVTFNSSKKVNRKHFRKAADVEED